MLHPYSGYRWIAPKIFFFRLGNCGSNWAISSFISSLAVEPLAGQGFSTTGSPHRATALRTSRSCTYSRGRICVTFVRSRYVTGWMWEAWNGQLRPFYN